MLKNHRSISQAETLLDSDELPGSSGFQAEERKGAEGPWCCEPLQVWELATFIMCCSLGS